MVQPVRYQLVRDRLAWEATLVGLEADGDGHLQLARLPGLSDGAPVALPPPWSADPSGIAAGPCGAVFIADTAADRILFEDRLCGTWAWLPAAAGGGLTGLAAPRGLAVDRDGLWIADSGHRRVMRLGFPALDFDREIAGALQFPTGVATDSTGRTYFLDRGLKRVLRHDAHGGLDAAHAAALAASGKLADPLWLAVGDGDQLFVVDGAATALRQFDADGSFVAELAPPGAGWTPGAIAAGAGRLYVANTATGGIAVFRSDGRWLADLPGFAGPVTALAVSEDGGLLLKCADDSSYFAFAAGTACAGVGTVTAGPFDAGETLDWFRSTAEADVPQGTALALEIAQAGAPTPAPGPVDWMRAPALDALLAPLAPSAVRRFLWLRATLSSLAPGASPLLRQLRSGTLGEDYRDYLPEIYRRDDEPDLFLFRLLALARTELGAVEERIDALPTLLSPEFAPASALPWLAGWLGLDLPRIADDAERRALIARAIALYRRRGTPAGIRDMAELHTGVRPSLLEAFEARGLWVLDVNSALGFDTGLPATDPAGMVVPDAADPLERADGCATQIGSAIVGQSGPLEIAEIGQPLFLDAAHRFVVTLPAYRAADPSLRKELRRIIDAEKPAHTDYHLCLVEPDMRVGFQSQVGVDTIVGGPPPPLRLDAALIGVASSLPAAAPAAVRVGQGLGVGPTSALG